MKNVEQLEMVTDHEDRAVADEMTQVMYASTALVAFSSRDLADLLAGARANNEACDISGFLVHLEGSFLQVLEGPREAVEQLYRSIVHDDRHTRCRLLLRNRIEQREFGEWSMGFADPRQVASELAGYVDLNVGLERLVEDAERAKSTLAKFRDGSWR